jgi:hypothetical protein
MVAMGHGLCACFGVCGETTKKKEKSKIVNVPWSLKDAPTLAIGGIFGNRAAYRQEIIGVHTLSAC